jgi:hypothetical protein
MLNGFFSFRRPYAYIAVIYIIVFFSSASLPFATLKQNWEGNYFGFIISWFYSQNIWELIGVLCFLLTANYCLAARFSTTRREWGIVLFSLVASGQIFIGSLGLPMHGVLGLSGSLFSICLIIQNWRPFHRPLLLLIITASYFLITKQHDLNGQFYDLFGFLIGSLVGISWIAFRYLLREHRRLEFLLAILSIALLSMSFYAPYDSRYGYYKFEQEVAKSPQTFLQKMQELNREQIWMLVQPTLQGQYKDWGVYDFLKQAPESQKYFILTGYYLNSYKIGELNYDLALRNAKFLPENSIDRLNVEAMIYCGAQDSSFWDFSKGLEKSRALNEKSSWKVGAYLDTYASCLAAKRKWSQAIAILESAKDLDSITRVELRHNLKLVQSKKRIFYPAVKSVSDFKFVPIKKTDESKEKKARNK